VITVGQGELREDRYSRFRQISWWDQAKIAACRVLVVGAGALGNEILKNLALLGFRRVVVVDLDRIEESNLSRTVLYRDSDIGSYKAPTAARAYRDLAPGSEVTSLVADVMSGCGLGLFDRSDVIIGGLDNREARLWLNRCAWRVGKPWIDGAIEGINGVARVFLPGRAPCYECTLGEVDWAILERRMSCNLLAHDPEPQGKIPTTPTISSIIGGIQVQEALKLIHGLPVLAGRGYVFEGLNHSSYTVDYSENPDCMSHYTLPVLTRLASRSQDLTLHALWERAMADLGAPSVTVEFSRDVVSALTCPRCGEREELFVPVSNLRHADSYCRNDGQMRVVETTHGYTGVESWGAKVLDQLGLPLFDIYTARSGDTEVAYLIAGDEPRVMAGQS
jgi:molybdopterin/thiamine biosynthesis adenylyltransferase